MRVYVRVARIKNAYSAQNYNNLFEMRNKSEQNVRKTNKNINGYLLWKDSRL